MANSFNGEGFGGFTQGSTFGSTPEVIRAQEFGSTYVKGFSTGGAFSATGPQFTTTSNLTATSSLVASAGTDERIVVFGIDLISNADLDTPADIFTISLYEVGSSESLMVAAATAKGPFMLDFAQPITTSPGGSLAVVPIAISAAGTSINIISIRYGVFPA